MKAAILIAGASALLASAKPINKRVMETEWVTDYVTVTVVAGEEEAAATDYVVLEAEPTTVTTTVKTLHTKTHTKAKATTTSTTSTAPAVVYSTVWVQAQDISSSSSSEAAAATTVVKVVSSKAETTAAAATTTSVAAATAASDSSSDSSSDSLSLSNDYDIVMTNYHNIHRTNHSAPDLAWDSDLASYAQTVADRCVFAHDRTVGSNDSYQYGQNIAAFSSSALSTGEKNKYGAVAVTDQWYNSEVENWSYYGQTNPPKGLDLDSYGHFTALVWKATSQVGCGTAYCPGMYGTGMDGYYTVCNYYTQGNWGGLWGKNVLPPLGNKVVTV